MKKIAILLSSAVLMAAFVACQQTPAAPAESTESASQKGSIVYFNLDRILNEYDMANDLSSVVQTKIESIEQEVTRRGNKLQNDINTFQEKIDKGLLTRSVAEAQNEKLQKQQVDFQNYYNQKQQEMNEELAVMQNQILDAVKTFIDKFNETAGYAMIIATQGDIFPQPVVIADPELDITDALLEGLNAEYVATKSSK